MNPIKTLAAIALTVAASHVFAGWVEVGSGTHKGDKDNALTVYYDHSRTTSINRAGSLKIVFTLQNFDKETVIDGVTFTSFIGRIEVDCRNQKFQTVAFFFYPEPMGKGKVLKTVSEPSSRNDWEYPAPNSVMEDVMSQACKR